MNRVLFVGLGGAGQRHLRIFRSLLPDTDFYAFRRNKKTPLLNPDFTVDNSTSIENKYNINLVDDLDSCWKLKPDFVVVSTPTKFHSDISIDASNHGVDVFVEKPGCVTLREAQLMQETFIKNDTNLFISFQRRFHPLVKVFRNGLNNVGNIINIQVNVGSYVPSWHPYENCLDLYAFRKDLGGGVVRTECHEIDLVTSIFGVPNNVRGLTSKQSSFDIDVEDTANFIFEYDSFCVTFNLSFVQNRQERIIKVNGQDGWLEYDLLEQRVTKNNEDVYNKISKSDDSYLDSLVSNAKIIDKITGIN
jgi:predicted dehydrogenase